MEYTGNKCPICGEEFKENDDIVVCPDCGAPYHRACYKEMGHCVLDHTDGAQWKTEAEPTAPAQKAEEKTSFCPYCGGNNPADAQFCNHCGAPLKAGQNAPENDGQRPPFSSSPFPGLTVFSKGSGFDANETLAEGVTVGEAAHVVMANPFYYLPLFRRIRDRNKSRFNFCAALFTGGWFMYRKQYKVGIPLAVLMVILEAAYTLLTSLVTEPLALQLLQQAGVDTSATLNFTAEQAIVLVDILQKDPQSWLLLMVPALLRGLQLALMIACGIIGNRMYFNHCIRTVRDVKAQNKEPKNLVEELRMHGGVNTAVMFILFIVYMILNYVPVLLL